MALADLEQVAAAMVAADKGILAADESSGTIKKRFDKIGLESTVDARRGYRELLLTTPGMAKSISGVIFYDETLRQKSSSGVLFPELLTQPGRAARHQGRCRRQAAGRVSGRNHYRGPRRPA